MKQEVYHIKLNLNNHSIILHSYSFVDDNQLKEKQKIIIKEIDDRNAAQANYEIFCEGVSKKVIKTGVKEGVKYVVNSVLPGAGKYASTIADFVYDGLCEYEKHNLN